ncbi:MAG: hypothetical protein GX608_07015 [Lentisphaerae bacterium]|nr:hypothetical protein [Lentisphaerota bacterium]
MEHSPHFSFLMSAPLAVLSAWLALEALRFGARKAGARLAWLSVLSRLLCWAARPWAAWGLFNLVFRWRREQAFNHPETFPFYANPWFPGWWLDSLYSALSLEGALAGLLLACCVAAAAIAIVVLPRREPSAARGWLTALAISALAFAFALSVNRLPRIYSEDPKTPPSLLAAWHDPASTLLYAMPLVSNPARFLQNYAAMQPRLRRTIHGLSHPPGAPLSLYALGRIAGAGGDIRAERNKLRYAVALTAAGALNALLLYALGAAMTSSRKIGLCAALLWALCPAFTAYATFAQDVFYALFFNLALLLLWRSAAAAAPPWPTLVALGLVFFCLTMLTYSWVLATTLAAAFLGIAGLQKRRPWRDTLARIALPLAVMTLAAAALLVYARLDYLAAYRVASGYVREWYRLEGVYQWCMALVGGQLDILLMMGSLAAAAFLAAATGREPLRADGLSARLFLGVLLAVYALPLLFGPHALKMETARCWHWVTTVPLVLAAWKLGREERFPRLAMGAAAGVSAGTSLVLGLLLNFGA